MKNDNQLSIEVSAISAHPNNRQFENTGEEWERFIADILENGVKEAILIRQIGKGEYQCLEGHRRLAAAKQAGFTTVVPRITTCTDEEAVRAVWAGNMYRENLSHYDEAVGVNALITCGGMTAATVAAAWRRSVEWVHTRQHMLDLGDEVLEAVRRTGRDRLTIGAVEEILRVPVELRAEATQLVLHPVMGTLSATEAHDVIQKCVLAPLAAADDWQARSLTMLKAWTKTLAKDGDTHWVQCRPLAEAETFKKGYENAEERVPAELLTADAPHRLRWCSLAVRHQMPVQIVPDGLETMVVANAALLIEAERALEEAGETNWIISKRRNSGVTTEPAIKHEAEKRVSSLVRVNMAPVNTMLEWTSGNESRPVPTDFPEWAKRAIDGGYLDDIIDVCEWVKSLEA